MSCWSQLVRVSKLTDYPDGASEVCIIEPHSPNELFYSPSSGNVYLSAMVGVLVMNLMGTICR